MSANSVVQFFRTQLIVLFLSFQGVYAFSELSLPHNFNLKTHTEKNLFIVLSNLNGRAQLQDNFNQVYGSFFSVSGFDFQMSYMQKRETHRVFLSYAHSLISNSLSNQSTQVNQFEAGAILSINSYLGVEGLVGATDISTSYPYALLGACLNLFDDGVYFSLGSTFQQPDRNYPGKSGMQPYMKLGVSLIKNKDWLVDLKSLLIYAGYSRTSLGTTKSFTVLDKHMYLTIRPGENSSMYLNFAYLEQYSGITSSLNDLLATYSYVLGIGTYL